jgi:hypothetical protein
MKPIKLKHILIAALGPLLFFSLGLCVYQSLKRGKLDLIGIVVGFYYFIPAVLFTLIFVALRTDTKMFSSLIGHFFLSMILCLLLFTLWTLFDGGPRNFRSKGFSSYWISELKRYWPPLVYFGITIPIILKMLGRPSIDRLKISEKTAKNDQS